MNHNTATQARAPHLGSRVKICHGAFAGASGEVVDILRDEQIALVHIQRSGHDMILQAEFASLEPVAAE